MSWIWFEVCFICLEATTSISMLRTACGGFHSVLMIALCHEYLPMIAWIEEGPLLRQRYASVTETSMHLKGGCQTLLNSRSVVLGREVLLNTGFSQYR